MSEFSEFGPCLVPLPEFDSTLVNGTVQGQEAECIDTTLDVANGNGAESGVAASLFPVKWRSRNITQVRIGAKQRGRGRRVESPLDYQ